MAKYITRVYGNRLLGAYAFVDRNTSQYNQNFWVVNPGIEYMDPMWDAHVNGYWPVSSRNINNGTFWGADLGLNSASVVDRTLYENLYTVWDVTGPGLDGEVGFTLPSRFFNVRAFVGGYHFNSSHLVNNINGVEGGIEVPVRENFRLIVRNAYDRVQGNNIMGTLRLTIGSLAKTSDVRSRMLDPIQRHLGAYQTGAGIPITRVNEFSGQVALLSNIWFFNPGGAAFNPALGLANCTFGQPCGILSQAALDGINALSPNANLFLNTGTYDNPLIGTGFTLATGQNFYGRANYFLKPATGSNRPLINDSLILSGTHILKGLEYH